MQRRELAAAQLEVALGQALRHPHLVATLGHASVELLGGDRSASGGAGHSGRDGCGATTCRGGSLGLAVRGSFVPFAALLGRESGSTVGA
jgi:hypothetical protein